jgi:hypothetical protein
MTHTLIENLGLIPHTITSKHKAIYGIYSCGYCGKHFRERANRINTRKSCGCTNDVVTHSLSKHKYAKVWYAMISRCNNKKCASFVGYGGRGIKVCEEWLDIRNFLAWVDNTRIEGYSIDRINNDGDYEPSNCRWADATTQACNQRMNKTNTSGYTGVSWNKSHNKWEVRIKISGVKMYLGLFEKDELEKAVLTRDNYIKDNNLPHKLSTDYKNS